ncbi:exodeoxyribonuclease-3 [Arenibacter nanhaiticus]|uniref:Exodeoxyribonuclease-3 n=1 Tax=Arenibacter nanhaiticus TaxID=558155 RepID=A0A1M6GAU7_9FLAO|nr:exodeoxyribonuclease III [Arenibacter nanhaiticus]SHJ06967.1 exodeoxyribonuclease-3 [Arenibacter nanhaiticus]
MKIISWNVNGIRAAVKKEFFESIQLLNPDILCLQETKAQENEAAKATSPLQGFAKFHNAAEKKGYSGTALYSKEEPLQLTKVVLPVESTDEGRIQCAEYDKFYLVNVYVPNSGQQLDRLPMRKEWDAEFLEYLKNLEKTKAVIVCGDFNVAHTPMDLKNDKQNYNKTAGYTQVEIDGMQNLIDAGFTDTFRFFHPNEVAYTYWSYRFKARERNIGWRIDYFLVSKSLEAKISSAEIFPEVLGSDHCPIALTIDI